jgi:hypothetical protein
MERQFCAALSVDPARKFAGSGRLRGLLVAAIIERRARAVTGRLIWAGSNGPTANNAD